MLAGNNLQLLSRMFGDLCRFAPVRVLLVLLLTILTSLFAGVGILMIIPLISAVGINLGGGAGVSTGDIGQRISAFADGLGITLTLGWILSIYVLLISAVAALRYAQAVLGDKLMKSFVLVLRKSLYDKLMNARWRFVNDQRQADFVRLVTGQVTSIGTAVSQVTRLLGQFMLLALYVGLSVLLSPTLTALALLCALALVVVLLPLNKRVLSSGRIGLRENRAIFFNVMEQVSAIKVIKSFSAERRFLERVIRASARLEEQQVRITRFGALVRLVNLVSAALIFAVLFYVSIQGLQLATSNLVLILFVFSRLLPQVSGIQSTVQRLIHIAPTYTDLLEHLAALEAHGEPLEPAVPVPEFQDCIELKGVGYHYPGKPSAALSRVDLRLGRNETVALTGPSGAGKSTLADILSGLISPSAGEMRVDGELIDMSNRRHWRRQVAYVTQDVLLFHDTVRENLSWVLPGAPPEKELWRVLEQASAADFVRALPQGLDTVVGTRGALLSGGERQRLALARALLSNPRLLILDETTSALDPGNQVRIREALRKLEGQVTMVIIAHNEVAIAHVQRRLELAAPA